MPVVSDFTALLSGRYWNGIEVVGRPTIITYSFTEAAPGYLNTTAVPDLTAAAIASFTPFTMEQRTAARLALAEWADASGIIFIEVASGQGEITFQSIDLSTTAYSAAAGIGYYPFGAWNSSSYPNFLSDLDVSGDVFMNTTVPFDYQTVLHEIGHALGLKHPTEATTNFAADPDVVHDEVLASGDPNLTIMAPVGPGFGLKPLDFAAVQHIYGTQSQDGTQVAYWAFDSGTQVLTQKALAAGGDLRGVSVKDYVIGAAGDDRIYSLSGNDTVFGLGGVDTIFGGDGDDFLDGGEGSDTLYGGTGNDRLYSGGGGGHLLDGGVGNDTIYANGLGLDTILGGDGDDVIAVSASGLVQVFSAAGNDLIDARHGQAYVVSGSGNDTVHGSATQASQLYAEDGNDRLYGGAADDWLSPGTGSDTVYGGGGFDTIDYSAAIGGVYVMLRDRFAYETTVAGAGYANPSTVGVTTMDYLYEISNAFGSAFDDRLYGGSNGNYLSGGASADMLYGLDGQDTLFGGDGADKLVGGNGLDYLQGDAGADAFYFTGLETGGYDGIGDFQSGTDTINLRAALGVVVNGAGGFQFSAGHVLSNGTDFFAFAGGGVSGQTFGSGPSLAYDSSFGGLYLDADGGNGANATLIAVLYNAPLLLAGDINLYTG